MGSRQPIGGGRTTLASLGVASATPDPRPTGVVQPPALTNDIFFFLFFQFRPWGWPDHPQWRSHPRPANLGWLKPLPGTTGIGCNHAGGPRRLAHRPTHGCFGCIQPLLLPLLLLLLLICFSDFTDLYSCNGLMSLFMLAFVKCRIFLSWFKIFRKLWLWCWLNGLLTPNFCRWVFLAEWVLNPKLL